MEGNIRGQRKAIGIESFAVDVNQMADKGRVFREPFIRREHTASAAIRRMKASDRLPKNGGSAS